jgi:hypothetical protein
LGIFLVFAALPMALAKRAGDASCKLLVFVGGSAVSSLRPLLTILLLAAVGVVLYMKINETEPVIPAGVGDWTAGSLEIGGGSAAGELGSTTSPPAYADDAAPPFNPGAIAANPTPPSTADEAPSWSPGPAALGTQPATANATAPPAANVDSSPVARSAETEAKLPEMPAMPNSSSSAESTAKAAEVAAAVPVAPLIGEPTVETPPAATAKSETASTDAPAAVLPPSVAATETKPDASVAVDPITPTNSTPEAPLSPTTASLYPSVRVAVQAELERGELGQALMRLSDWYGDPSLSPAESQEVETLLSQLAGSVIWEGPPAHRLEPAYVVKAGESLQDIAEKFDVPWQLLAKINGVADPAALQAGQELKVMRGKFSALVDLSERTMTLMLDRRYAGKFAIEMDPATAIEEGQWKVDQKLLTPGGGGVYGPASGSAEDRSLLLANAASPNSPAAVLRGPGSSDPASPQPAGRVIRLKSADVNDVYDILSVGSRVTIRR